VEDRVSAEGVLNIYIDHKQRHISKEDNFIKDFSQNSKPHMA